MGPRPRRRRLVLALVLAAVVAVAGCVPGEPEVPAPPVEGTDTPGSEHLAPGTAAPDGPQPVAPTPAVPEGPAEPPPSAAPTGQPPGDAAPAMGRRPVRAVWVHLFDDTLKSRASIAQMVDEMAGAGTQVILAQVARRHDAYYRSEVLPATPDPGLEPGLDVVEELTTLAHAAGIEVHAWISLTPTWHQVYEELPAPAGWVATAHGPDAPEAERWVTRTVDGAWSDTLDPALPEVRDHLAGVVAELVARYPIDGVHLDYARYASDRHGYHPRALERFRAETGGDGGPAGPLPAPDDPAWSAWRREQTRALVGHLAAAARREREGVAVSAAVITWGAGPSATPGGFDGTRAAAEALQDWPGWVRDGLLDAVFPMNYFRAHEPEQAAWFEQWLTFEEELAAASDVAVVPGIGGWLNRPAATLGQVHAATARTDGAAVYSFQQPTDDASRSIWADLKATGWGVDATR